MCVAMPGRVLSVKDGIARVDFDLTADLSLKANAAALIDDHILSTAALAKPEQETSCA